MGGLDLWNGKQQNAFDLEHTDEFLLLQVGRTARKFGMGAFVASAALGDCS